jgi:hypothetical protein
MDALTKPLTKNKTFPFYGERCSNVHGSSALLSWYTDPTSHGDLEYARALEVVCASVALQQFPIHHGKPTTPTNGFYGVDGGDISRPIVRTEVLTVREIVDLLLWDGWSFRVS